MVLVAVPFRLTQAFRTENSAWYGVCGCPFREARRSWGGYQSYFPFFLRRLRKSDRSCGRLPFAISLFPSPPPDAWRQMRAATIRNFPFSFAAAGCLAADAGGYYSHFPFFLRHLWMQISRCGRLPFAVSLFPLPPQEIDKWSGQVPLRKHPPGYRKRKRFLEISAFRRYDINELCINV